MNPSGKWWLALLLGLAMADLHAVPPAMVTMANSSATAATAVTATAAASATTATVSASTTANPAPNQAQSAAAAQVRAAESAFAQSMAERNHARFAEFISEEAIFFTANEPYRGKAQVVAGWQRFFQGKEAPFSWRPDKVEVLASGNLALSTGPVHDPAGKLIAHFTSIWRQEAPGVWRIIFDKGEQVAPPLAQAKPASASPASGN